MIRHLLFICVLLFGLVVQAQTKEWSLQECIDYALDHNITIKQGELDKQLAEIDKTLAIGQMLPSINANINGSSNRGLSLNPTTNQLENATMLSASGAINAGVTLFEGLKKQRELQRTKINELAASYRLDKMKDDVVLHVANAYLQIVLNKENLELVKQRNEVTLEQLERTQHLVDAGSLPQGDLLEIKADDAREKQQIIEAENEVAISLISLAQLLRIKEYQDFDIVQENFEIAEQGLEEPSVYDYVAKAKETRAEVKIAESSVELAAKDVDIARSSYYPSLSAFFGYNTRYAESDPTSFRRQLSINDGLGYGVQLNIPIFNGLSVRKQVQRSQIGLEKAKNELEQTELELESSVYQAYMDVKGAQKSYEAANAALQSQELAFEHSQNRFDAGLITAFEFSQAKSRLDQTMIELNQSKYNYIFKQKVLELYFGVPYSDI
ncbi:MAG TPA: TolC family protein [Flavobacteriaceae bacterium]|nr:TolC family protein [Flavobacteriaceae bacterium]